MKPNRIFLLILVFILGFSFHCKKSSTAVDIASIKNNKNLGDREIISQVIGLIFKDQLKDWSLTKDDKLNKWKIAITYGGSMALTFHSQKEYARNIIQTHALYLSQLFAATSGLSIAEIQLSLMKPLYVKDETNPDAGIQEFEIFRTRLNGEKGNNILKTYPNLSPFGESKQKKDDLLLMVKDFEKNWTIELNELTRITVE